MNVSALLKLKIKWPIVLAILAAVLYGISAPVAKVLLTQLSPYVLAALLYLGAGLGMSVLRVIRGRLTPLSKAVAIPKKEMIFVVGMILLDIAAPIFLMLGLSEATAGTAALLNNFEIVVTSLLALVLFKEAVGRRMWLAIGLMTCATILLSMGPTLDFKLTPGAIWILLASVSWGLENNCTRMLSLNDPLDIVIIKGIGSGLGALSVALLLGAWEFTVLFGVFALLLGFVAYGLSIFFYIYAQRDLGAARTSAYYAAAPFVGVLASWLFLKEPLTMNFAIALLVMLLGTYFAVTEDHVHQHEHVALYHDHAHTHDDLHHDHDHTHQHEGQIATGKAHRHGHAHKPVVHKHAHWPDLHHTHAHE